MKTSYFLMPAFFLLITTTSFNSKDVTPVNYEKHKQEIQLEKMKLKTQYDSATIEERDKLLIKASGYL